MNNFTVTTRDRTIDNIRGFAIFLVVVGHCIMRFYEYNAAFADNYWFRLIYSFHMPLFMFVGGWVAWLTFDGTLTKLKKRTLAHSVCRVECSEYALFMGYQRRMGRRLLEIFGDGTRVPVVLLLNVFMLRITLYVAQTA